MAYSPEFGEQLRHLFNDLAELDPEARAERLDEACRDDPDLRREIESLLEAHGEPIAVLDVLKKALLRSQAADDVRGIDPLRMVGQFVSHYEIQAYLGGGGMGVVYRARDARLKRDIALKFMPRELLRDPHARERFIHEAQAASALDHPNICTIYEIDETEDGQTFIAMACYEGETLKEKIERGALPMEEALDYAVHIAEGLGGAHEADIVHRDVKPANVLVTERGRVKIVDFGLAKMADVSLTKTGMTMGTVSYMSPEQASGGKVDHRTDLWSLGVVLYEMLAGERPFQGDYAEAVMYAIRHEAPAPLRTLRPDLQAALEHVIEKALAKSPEQRYQHAEEMLADLRSVPGREALETGRTLKASSRNRRVGLYVGASILVLVLLGLGLLVSRQGFRPRTTASPMPLDAGRAIAVLPLENRSGDESQAYIAQGMTDELTAMLTRINGLRVVPRQSLLRYTQADHLPPDLAKHLRVDYFVDGSVLWAGEQVRITVNLIDPMTESSLWGRSFVGAQRDVLVLQQEAARAIVREVEVELTPEDEARLGRPRVIDPKAYELFRKAGELRPSYEFAAMKNYYEQAIAIDSTYADAYAALANTYIWMGLLRMLSSEEAVGHADQYLTKALELDEASLPAYAARAQLKEMEGDWLGAEEIYRQLIELDPRNYFGYCTLGIMLMKVGRLEEAQAQATYALSLNPLSWFAYWVIVQAKIYGKRYDEAIASSRKALELFPTDWIGYWGLGRAYLAEGRHEEALRMFEKSIAADSSSIRERTWRTSHLGYAYAVAGRRAEARAILANLKATPADLRGDLDYASRIHVALGEKKEALDWLEEHASMLDYLKVDPAFDPIRSEPRFQALLEKLGWGM